MAGYWIRHRFQYSLIICAALAFVTAFLFVTPYIMQRASRYNSQSVYKNSEMDFIAPEPSFDQVSDIPGTHGIDKIFPFFLTKTQVEVNGDQRSTTVLLSDQLDNVDITMYNPDRLIEESSTEYDNPVFVDWAFCHDTSSGIGDKITITIGGESIDYTISAIYETNSVYDNGAILAPISEEQKNLISEQSNNTGYSGMYLTAENYDECKKYLTEEYRPLGRLKDRSQFESDEQYQVHYDAIMSSGYANEITDFRVLENNLTTKGNSLLVWIGAVISIVVLLVFNIVLANRGEEKIFFRKNRIPKGQAVLPYYSISFFFETVASIALYVAFLILRIKLADDYISIHAYSVLIAIVPVAVIITELICRKMNSSMVSRITREVEEEMRKKRKEEMRANAEALKNASNNGGTNLKK